MRRLNVDVVVVGGGPAGLSVASRIRDLDVVVFEEHLRIGVPKHCAGVVGYETARVIEAETSPRVIDHKYRRVVFTTPSYRVDLVFKRNIAFHVNRPLLEELLASKTESLGHRVVLGSKAYPQALRSVLVNGHTVRCKYLVVADGASSVFRERFTDDNLRYLVGLQVRARVKNLDENTLYVFYTNLIPEFYAWIIPLGEEALIGSASFDSSRAHRVLQCIEKYIGISATSIYERFGGLIPIYRPLRNPVLREQVVFHGDSVPLNKPYTGGGLHYIFKLSPVLAELIEENRLREYSTYYTRIFYSKCLLERVVVNYLRKLKTYFLPIRVVKQLNSLSLLQELDFDKHYRLILKSISVAPVLAMLGFSGVIKALYNVLN